MVSLLLCDVISEASTGARDSENLSSNYVVITRNGSRVRQKKQKKKNSNKCFTIIQCQINIDFPGVSTIVRVSLKLCNIQIIL